MPHVLDAATPYKPHTGLVVYTICAGLLMVAFGAYRLRASLPQDSPYSVRSVRGTYLLMIALGLLLIVLAVRWRFFP